MSRCTFSGVAIIESVENPKSADELFADLQNLKFKYEDEYRDQEFFLEQFSVANKTEFIGVLKAIDTRCQSEGIIPIIHLECHGNEDESGLVLKNGEEIKWEELGIYIREINISLEHNLIVGLSVCFGASFLSSINLTLPAPFWAIIGSIGKIYEVELSGMFSRLYREILEGKTIFDSINGINSDYTSKLRFFSSEIFFAQGMKLYFENSCNPNSVESNMRVHSLALKVAITQPHKWTYQSAAQHAASFYFSEESKKSTFEKYSSIFFMKCFPENLERFSQYSYGWINTVKLIRTDAP